MNGGVSSYHPKYVVKNYCKDGSSFFNFQIHIEEVCTNRCLELVYKAGGVKVSAGFLGKIKFFTALSSTEHLKIVLPVSR